MPSTDRVDGQVAVVTGGSRGIGRAVALALAERGADIAVFSRTASASEAVAADVRARGRRAFAGGGDVSNWSDVQRLVEQSVRALGSIDVLINNAGVGGAHAEHWNLDPESFRETLMVNILGPFHCMKAVVPSMIERRRGVVINLSSGVARRPSLARAMYGTTKSGLDFLTRTAAIEAAPHGVRVYAFYPGPTDTDMQAELRSDPGLPAAVRSDMQARVTEGRLFQPDQPADAIAWLASPAGAAWTEPICGWSIPEVHAEIERLRH